MATYSIAGYKYISQRTINKIDKMTSFLMESGLDRYYRSFADFLFKLYSRNIYNEAKNDVQPITIQFMRGPLILYFYMLGFASIIFMIEFIPYHFIKLRSRRRVSHLQNPTV